MYADTDIAKLSKPQIRNLLNGKPVRVKHGEGMKIRLTPSQHKKLMSAHKKGRGSILSLEPDQKMMGQGVITEVIKEIGMELLPHAIDAVANVAKKRVGKKGHGIADDMFSDVSSQMMPLAIDAVAKSAKKRVGKGVTQEVVKIVKEVAKELAPHAIDAVAHSAKKRVGKGKKSGASEFFGKIGNAFKARFNDQGTPLERKATSVILNKIEPALIKPLQVLAPPVGQIAEAQRDVLKTHYGLGVLGDAKDGAKKLFNPKGGRKFLSDVSKGTADYFEGKKPSNSPFLGMGKRGKLVKGSPEAKAYMASIRAKKKGGALMVAGESGGALAPAGYSYYQ